LVLHGGEAWSLRNYNRKPYHPDFFLMILISFLPLCISDIDRSEPDAVLARIFFVIKFRYERIMANLLNLFIALLVIGWLIGFVALDAGGLIHMLLVIAVIVLLLKIIAGNG